MSGKVVHFEVPFEDGARARTFYRDAFGWQLSAMPQMDYTIASTGPTADTGMPSEPGFINGGMYARTEQYPTSPVLVLEVSSIEDTLKTIEGRGGATVVGKEPVGEMGFSAYFRDTEGNLLGLWENAPQG